MSSAKTNVDDRYRAPRVPVSDGAPLEPHADVWDIMLVVFCGRIALEVSEAVGGSAQWRFLLAIAGIHTALLVGATAYFSYLARRARARV